MRKLAVLAALGLLVPALAGCADPAPSSTSEPLKQGSSGAPTTTVETEAPRPRGTSERWHFHDHWQGTPVLTLLQENVTLEPAVRDDGTPSYERVFSLPRGTIVPPETGFLTITVAWATPEPGPINLTYRAADAIGFAPFMDLANGEPAPLYTTESMCDVPHRQESHWMFNLSAPALVSLDDLAGGPRAPPTTVEITIQATIGRPLFIDPPHLDWWAGSDIIPLVTESTGEFTTLTTPLGRNVTLNGGVPAPSPRAVPDNRTVPVDEGRIVPEGARSVVVMVNWTTSVAGAKLAVRYEEGNYPSQGPLELVQDGESSRVFVLPVTNGMTDTTYSNRTTWQFHVLPEGETAAFHGSYTLFAWATRHASADAVRMTLGH